MSPKAESKSMDFLQIGIVFLTVGAVVLLATALWGTLAEPAQGLIRLGIVLGVLFLVAAAGFMAYSRRTRRSQRPEWLETQAWRQDLQDKLRQPEKKS